MPDRERQPLLRGRSIESQEFIEKTPVYPIIHMIKRDIMHFVETPLTYEALIGPDLTYTLVMPLEDKYNALQRDGNRSIVFCFLLNRIHFLRDDSITTSSISQSRATLCEIMAIRSLRAHGTADNTLQLTLAMTYNWNIYAGADEEILSILRGNDDEVDERVGNAIELAIIGKAKRFIKCTPAQRVIDSIWTGKCVYQATSTHSFLQDTYKQKAIHFYDPHRAPLLDHYRLKVPAIRSVLEYGNFIILFVLFIFALETNEERRITIPEAAFMIYGLGFALEKVAAMQEHGMRVYFNGTWNGFDLAFVTLFLSYGSLRVYGVYHDNHFARHSGIDCLAVIAVLMFPRLAFVTLRNNLMVLSLRAMMAQFVALMLIAAFCFGGFLYALWTLSRNRTGYPATQIAWWMLDLWFGLDASGFDRAGLFHPFFGPVLMVTYACLSNTLLLTVLVSILSHTFTIISEDAVAEAMFRRAVSTIEGVKADPLFSYQPPVNLIALLIMFPASYILSPRWFHKLNVFMIRLTSFPILLLIAWYERQAKKNGTIGFYDTFFAAAERLGEKIPRQLKRISIFEGLAGSGTDIDTVFEIEEERTTAVSDTEDVSIGVISPTTAASSSQVPSPAQMQRSPSNTKAERGDKRTLWPLNTQLPLRHRATSILNRPEVAQTPASPLAQVFQPFTLGVDTLTPLTPAAAEAVSFGPITRRRRLSSMHLRGSSGDYGATSPAVATGRRPFPTTGSSEGSKNTPSPGLLAPLSSSPETAAQIEEEQRSEGGYRVLEERLERMDERQKRIEDLLVRISRSIGQ